MKLAYLRPTKLHPEAEQRAALAGNSIDEWYVDEKPKRGEPGWYFRDKLIFACRKGAKDEIHVSHASIIADSVTGALEKLAEITARGAVLVIASTGKRYRWHPDAALGMELALEMEREARRLVAKIGGDKFAANQAERRERRMKKHIAARDLWLDKTVPTDEVVKRTGMTRDALYNQFGARGLPRFVGVKKEPT
jgi:hypothetical protein